MVLFNKKLLFIFLLIIICFSLLNLSNDYYIEDSSGSTENVDLQENTTIYVDIKGAINNPGVYEVDEETRIFEVIELAGGYNNANEECINEAKIVYDQQEIYIPHQDEECSKNNDSLININTASKEDLKTLPGIGDSKADAIIDYRETNGSFTSTEEIMNVSGIGESTYENIKDLITI